MSDRPNRNWRSRMRASADQWLSSAARVLWEMPLRQDEPARTDGLRNRFREAYLAGYQDGRKRDS